MRWFEGSSAELNALGAFDALQETFDERDFDISRVFCHFFQPIYQTSSPFASSALRIVNRSTFDDWQPIFWIINF